MNEMQKVSLALVRRDAQQHQTHTMRQRLAQLVGLRVRRRASKNDDAVTEPRGINARRH